MRLAYLAVTNAFAALRLLPMSDRDKTWRFSFCGISLLFYSGSWAQRGRGSPVPIVRSWPPCSHHCLEMRNASISSISCIAVGPPGWSIRSVVRRGVAGSRAFKDVPSRAVYLIPARRSRRLRSSATSRSNSPTRRISASVACPAGTEQLTISLAGIRVGTAAAAQATLGALWPCSVA